MSRVRRHRGTSVPLSSNGLDQTIQRFTYVDTWTPSRTDTRSVRETDQTIGTNRVTSQWLRVYPLSGSLPLTGGFYVVYLSLMDTIFDTPLVDLLGGDDEDNMGIAPYYWCIEDIPDDYLGTPSYF